MKECDKKGIVSEYLPWLLIGVAVLVILMITVYYLRGEGITLIDRLKDLFKFR
ncbi:MAG: hypothetical protein OQK82_01790 [Candidatus Pacearchaeota archaeon]|nr:hypothetical protein [Candidatus Pacearchaeota archaeon]